MAGLTNKEKQSSKKHMWETIPATVIYLLMVAGSQYLLKGNEATIWTYPLALSPLIPAYFIVRSLVNFVKRSDELIQKLYGDSAIITLLIVIFSGFAYGFLTKVGLPQPDIFWAATLICPLYFIVLALLRRKYGMEWC